MSTNPPPLSVHRLPPKRLPFKPFDRLFGRSLGLAAALVAATGLSAAAVAQPMAASAERGDLALVPYYTVRNQWVTGIHIVNTSDHTQVVKVRFRRATDSMDALDFNVVMSPRDVYAGFLSDDENGAISWSSPDTTCTVPATQANRLTLPPVYRVGAESGYVEIIAMGQAETERQPIAVAAKHSNATSTPPLTPRDCAAVRSNFFADGRAAVAATPGTAAVAGRRGVVGNRQTFQPGVASASNATIRAGGTNTYTDSGNVLKVSYFIRDNATGIEFGDNAVHIADFLGLPSITNQEYGVISGDLNGFDFPDLDGTGLPRTGTATGLNPTIVRNRFNLLRRSDVLGVDSIINEWSVNPANGVQMDWVVTLPGQYTMLKLPQYRASLGSDGAWVSTVNSAGLSVVNPQCPRSAIPATGTAAAVDACDHRDMPVRLTYEAYNREEFKGEDASTLVVSPQAPTELTTYLPKEVNVITFGGKSVLGQSDANVTANLGQPFGWLEAKLGPQSNARVCAWDPAQDAVSPGGTTVTAGQALTVNCLLATGEVPVIGFAAWARKVAANPDASYGRIIEHSYERDPVPRGLRLSAGNAQVTASWQAVPGATGYKLYYSTTPLASRTDFTSVSSVTVPGTSATVTGLTNGTIYHFVVVATTSAGGESAASTEARAAPRIPDVGGVFRDSLRGGGQGPQMVVLPTGSFSMGSPPGEMGRDNDEGPVRTVTIGKRIAMGRYEVTFAEYDRFVAATSGRSPRHSGWGRGTRPVINVNWNEAKAYAAWLSAQTGKTYRLPSEAEWEYAARARTRTLYSWGDGINCGQARYGRRFGGACSNSSDGTVPVGSFAPNGFGLFDMHGNVNEWVEDCYVNTYTGAPSDGSARTSGCGAPVRAVVRGGSWLSSPRALRAANRVRLTPSNRNSNWGFRLVRDLNP